MKFARYLALVPVMLAATPALAGEEVLYGPAPDWVDVTPTSEIDPDATGILNRLDRQQRIEDGTVTTYIDRAIKLSSAEALTQAGTSTATWMPERGDLTIHKVEIVRGDKVVDVLETGEEYTVLRREQQLENRTLDGILTATLAVPGLQIGDVLHIVFSQTVHDDTLQGGAQMSADLFSKPLEADFARNVISWPMDETVTWKANPEVPAPTEEDRGGYHYLTFDLPLPKREDLPAAAPSRFTRPLFVQAGTFASWQEVSSVFAPLYATDGTIAAGSPLAGEVARIAAASDDPVVRAAMATRLVQEQVSYLMNGMSGGNYTPQSPAKTWEMRFGDCKAKTLLLLSLLDGLGIEAEPLLINTRLSDALPELLPVPGSFDHVIVHAVIGGKDYWIDGTQTGARLANIADTPQFRYGLPIRDPGTGLMHIEPRLPASAVAAVDIELDERGGIDIPALVHLRAELSGQLGSNLGSMIGQVSDEQHDDLVERFAASMQQGLVVTDGDISFDAETGIATVDVSGLMTTPWEREGAGKKQALDMLGSADFQFDFDRARTAWRDIPVEQGYPTLFTTNVKILLSDEADPYRMRGLASMDQTVGGQRVVRDAALDGNVFTVKERIESLGGELAAGDIGPARTAAARIVNSTPYLLAPAKAARAWEYGRDGLKGRLAPYEAAYRAMAERDPDDSYPHEGLALFRQRTGNLPGALEEIDKAIAIDPTSENHNRRALILHNLGRHEESLAARQKAFELDPKPYLAMGLAQEMGETGQIDAALALLEANDDWGDSHEGFVQSKAEVMAYGDMAEDGLAEIEALIAESPGKSYLLNSSCWYRARHGVGRDDMMDVCNRAVEQVGSPAVLDSRSLAWLTVGEPAKALADADAALAISPDMVASRYVRGFAQRALGDDAGESDIDYIARTWPAMAEEYARFGFKP
ncbi:DUF3857 domain-containing protein [Croceicoccus mobilis]|uniref:DUF3857 domain-containing protein n=1 Tax=Croceicoccus mobilis TaxID=1703339 RepID=A0A917DVA4_9SPHN|nr:DUF3857 domain-containing protein [Croceicoccus mobilis]GGD70139.1 hypothetical protein GCM10010990_19600 [Croceicoccus mobilis]